MSRNQFPELRTIEFPGTPWTRWGASLAAHAAFVALVIAVPWTVHEALRQQTEHVASLVDPALTPPRPVVKPVAPKPMVLKRLPPVIVKPVIPVRLPEPRVFVAPKTAVRVQPKVEVEAPAPAPVLPQVQPPAVAKIELPKPAPPIKVGGFGDPNGVQPSANPTAGKLTAAKLGAFELSEGNAHGKGSSGTGGAVALAGFGDAGSGSGGNGSGGNGRGQVRSAGFGDSDSAPAAPRAMRVASTPPVETPVEITFKPKPAYTPEAREKKIEGEVLLEVVFAATGQIHILRVTRGLGFGLDERAREAAEQIRFQPGMRAGTPVDMKGTVHIVFALS